MQDEKASKIKLSVSCVEVFKRFWPDHFREQGNCRCPFHDDANASFQLDDKIGYCHSGCGRFDVIALYATAKGITNGQAINELATELGLQGVRNGGNGAQRESEGTAATKKRHGLPLPEAALQFLASRGIVKAVPRLVAAGASFLPGNATKGWSPSIRVPLTDWTGKPLGAQYLPIGVGEKKFATGTPAKEVFFRPPGGDESGPVVVVEGVYDALSIAEAIPNIDVAAIMSANFVEKLRALKGRRIVMCLDNDEAGTKALWENALALLYGEQICNGPVAAVAWYRLPELIEKKCKDPNDLLRIGGSDLVRKLVEEDIFYAHLTDKEQRPSRSAVNRGHSAAEASREGEEQPHDAFETSRRLFPRVPFPWEILPDEISLSLQQLARSCATSPTPLPGAALALVSSAAGRNFSVSPKFGWKERSITWFGDIRPSGDGKTHAARKLCKPIEALQREEHARFEMESERHNGLSRKDREATNPPAKVRGFFLTGLTLEGLREDLCNHPTGGLIVIQDELSAFVSAQNQYRASGKGDDRESWLKLWDGHDARVVRAGGSVLISGACPSLVGGIQPEIFRRVFSSDNGVFLTDGTIFRFLFTYERSAHYPLGTETWGEHHEKQWERLLLRAFQWSDRVEKPVEAIFDVEAQELFFTWRNQIDAEKCSLHPLLKGFIPKVVTYAVRLAGAIHCLHQFYQGQEPDRVLTKIDVQRGIRIVEFYLGQVVDAMHLLTDEGHQPADERAIALAETLDGLRAQTDNGRLGVAFIRGKYNEQAPPSRQFSEDKRSKSFGIFLRECGLRVSDGVHDANGQRSVKCLIWDEKTDAFIRSATAAVAAKSEAEGVGESAEELSPEPEPMLEFEGVI